MTDNIYIMHIDYICIFSFRFYRLIYEYRRGAEQWNILERTTARFFLYSYSAEARTISFHCSHMAHRIIKLNMKPMSHGEAQIMREVSSVLTAAHLKRLCQLSVHCWKNKSCNIMHGDVWHMIAHWSIFFICVILHIIFWAIMQVFKCHSSNLNKMTSLWVIKSSTILCLSAYCELLPVSFDCDSVVYILAKENCITVILWCKL